MKNMTHKEFTEALKTRKSNVLSALIQTGSMRFVLLKNGKFPASLKNTIDILNELNVDYALATIFWSSHKYNKVVELYLTHKGRKQVARERAKNMQKLREKYKSSSEALRRLDKMDIQFKKYILQSQKDSYKEWYNAVFKSGRKTK